MTYKFVLQTSEALSNSQQLLILKGPVSQCQHVRNSILADGAMHTANEKCRKPKCIIFRRDSDSEVKVFQGAFGIWCKFSGSLGLTLPNCSRV